MPTAAKLVAALWFALVAWFAAELAKMYLPEGSQVGFMTYIAGGFGLLTGWIFVGRRAGDTKSAAIGYGISASVILSFWSIFYFAFETMIKRSLAHRYKGPTDALMGMVDLMREYALYLIKPDVLITLVVGALLGAWLVEKAARKWA